MVLSLEEADENGVYYPSMTKQVNFRFDKDADGKVEAMWLQQLALFQDRHTGSST